NAETGSATGGGNCFGGAYSYASINWFRFKGSDLRLRNTKSPLRTARTLAANAGNGQAGAEWWAWQKTAAELFKLRPKVSSQGFVRLSSLPYTSPLNLPE